MIKLISKVLLLLIIFTVLAHSNVLAYEDDLFKFDLPENYGNIKYQNMYVFSDSQDSNRGFVIYAHESNGLKKSVWDIEEDLNTIIRNIGGLTTNKVFEKDKKAKLGKEKAIKIIFEKDSEYLEVYILASNKYVYMVSFLGKTQQELNNTDYEMIKKSFKLKDRTTNLTAITIIIIIIVIGIKWFLKYKKQNNEYGTNNSENVVDYKNMTEEDFKRMDN